MNQPWIIGIVTLLYFFEAGRLIYIGQWQFGLTIGGYAIANIGIMAALLSAMSKG